MDLDGLFWIALIVFYFVSRALGNKRKQTDRPPQPVGPRQAERDDDLDAALGEIRRALGFPEPEETGPAPAADVPREQQVAMEQDEMRRRRMARERQAAHEQEEARRKAARRRQAAQEQNEMRRLEAREREAARERKRIARSQPSKRAPSEGRMDQPILPDLPPLRPSFAEEQVFEQVGRHAHRRTRHDLQVISPYDVPARKKLPSINQRLASRKSLREAFLLKEILDRPLSLRRR